MPISYTATDSRGRVHTRTSDRAYTHAVVWDGVRGFSGKPLAPIVAFAGSRQLAEARRGEHKTATSIEIVEVAIVPAKVRKAASAGHKVTIDQMFGGDPLGFKAERARRTAQLSGSTRTEPSSSLDAKAPRKPAEPRPSPAATIPAAGPTGRTYNGLTQAYDYFNRELFGGRLPACLVTLQRKAKTFGYFAADRFGTRDKSETTDEIALNPAHFASRSTREVLSTLVHEMAHLKRQREGKPPRPGYHDRLWAVIMREIGLIPSTTGQPGGKETGQKVSHYIEQGGRFDRACARLEAEGFDLAYVDLWDDQKAERAKKAAASKTKYTCPSCDANAWAKPEAKLICGDCDERMEEA